MVPIACIALGPALGRLCKSGGPASSAPNGLAPFFPGVPFETSPNQVFGLGSVPLSYLGARVAVRLNSKVLEPVFGIALLVIGVLGAADCFGWRLHF